jgi:IclR family transcriptional regulator, KDG regulon repressor
MPKTKLVQNERLGGEQVRPSPVSAVKERSGIQSLERAFAIIEEIARNRDGIGLADLSKRVGLHNSTTFHLCKTLVALGYIRQTEDTRRYRIGRMVFSLAASSLDEIELVNIATPIIEGLARVTRESSHIAVRAGDDIVIVARTAGSGAFQLADRAGVIRPAHCTALGKVLLAALSAEQLDRYLTGREFRVFTQNTITERGRLVEELTHVRDNGVAFDDGEFDSEVRCVAVPVRDFTGQIVAAIGISGPIWRLSIQALQEQTRHVRDAADHLSAELGRQNDGDKRSIAQSKK